MGVSSKTANPTYNVIISMRNILALVILVILAIYGYSDASPQGPPPRPQRPQRPIRPPSGSSTFRLIIVNLAFPKLAAGTVTFLGNGNRKCAQSYSTKNETALLTFPYKCHPLVAISATVNNNIPCTPYSTNSPPFPLGNFYVVPIKSSSGGVTSCVVCANATGKNSIYLRLSYNYNYKEKL